jgi:AcrR family transcriptional regulator
MYERAINTNASGEARSHEILSRARTAFAEKGFDGASMQDLARAAGMSVGNFYRYFPSKDAIIESLILRDMEDLEANFATILASDDPLAALRLGIAGHVQQNDCDGEGLIWAEITAAALRKPRIAELTGRMEAAIRDGPTRRRWRISRPKRR